MAAVAGGVTTVRVEVTVDTTDRPEAGPGETVTPPGRVTVTFVVSTTTTVTSVKRATIETKSCTMAITLSHLSAKREHWNPAGRAYLNVTGLVPFDPVRVPRQPTRYQFLGFSLSQ